MRTETDREPSPVLPGVQPGKLRQVWPKEYLIRFALGAAVSIVAGILSKTVSARFGGAFLAFPSILPASLTLIQKKEGTRRADRNAIGAVLGSAGLVVFAMAGEAAFGRIEPFAALLLALAGWPSPPSRSTACSLSCDRKAATGPRTNVRAPGRTR